MIFASKYWSRLSELLDFYRKKYGFSGVIAKPYKIKDLSKTLQKVMGK